MLPANLPQHHSAKGSLFLATEQGTFTLAQIGPEFIILDKPESLPPSDAVVIMQVDETERRWPVRLVDGVRPSDRQCAITIR